MSVPDAIGAVQARIAQITALVTPASSDASSASSSSTDFASVLAGLSDASGTSSGASSSPASLLGDSSDSASGSTASTLASLLGSSSASTASALATLLGGTSSSGTSSSTVTAQGLISDAEKYLGVPYKWGGDSLSQGGLDCSGLVYRSLSDLGVTGIPRTAKQQGTLGTAVPGLAQAQPGDLLVFNNGTHIAIYLGSNRMIESPAAGEAVRETTVWATPTSIRRILPQQSDVASASSTASTASTTAAAQRAVLQLLAAGSSS